MPHHSLNLTSSGPFQEIQSEGELWDNQVITLVRPLPAVRPMEGFLHVITREPK